MKKNQKSSIALAAAMLVPFALLTGCGAAETVADTFENFDASINGIFEAGGGDAKTAAADAHVAEAPAGGADDAAPEASPEAADDAADYGFEDEGVESFSSSSSKKAAKSSRKLAGDAFDGAASAKHDARKTTADMDDMKLEEPVDMPDIEPDIEPDIDISDFGEPFILTAGEWNDNENWGFFANLIQSGAISFPQFRLDPTARIAVNLTHDGNPVRNQTVSLTKDDKTVWQAKTDKNGNAYLFYDTAYAGDSLELQTDGAEAVTVEIPAIAAEGQGKSIPILEYEMTTDKESVVYEKTEVMFILDTTGSMGDEISYLQKDFSSIAEDVAGENITFSVNFYKDEGDDYVTRTYPFSDDLKDIQKKLNKEYANGGGDEPEAVAEILDETMCSGDWHEDTNKIAFLIYDAPPHDYDEAEEMIQNAIRTAAEKGVHLVPVVASNAGRATELFGRAAAIMTNSNYVFLTDDSGVGGSHLEPIIGKYDVELLHDIIVRNITELAE